MANLGVVGSPTAPKALTLSERLNISSNQIEQMCDRIELALARVNGTPGGKDSNAKVAGQPPLSNTVERLENLSQRLSSLADGVDCIA